MVVSCNMITCAESLEHKPISAQKWGCSICAVDQTFPEEVSDVPAVEFKKEREKHEPNTVQKDKSMKGTDKSLSVLPF